MNNNTRIQSKIEEYLNSITHGIGALISIPAIIYLIYYGVKDGDVYRIVAFTIYGISLFLIFMLSSFYHGIENSPLKILLNKLDHAGIFIFIAGTYTPFLLVTLRNGLGIQLLALVWCIAIFAVILEIMWFKFIKEYTVWICLFMGWMALSQLKPLISILPTSASMLLICGGLTFTTGIIFYKMDSVKYAHNIWHLFVLGGSGLHYFAMYYI